MYDYGWLADVQQRFHGRQHLQEDTVQRLWEAYQVS
jgi:hypothetical protein